MKKAACMNCGAEPGNGSAEIGYPQTDALVTIGDEQIEVKLTDCEFMNNTFPDTFHRPTPYVCNNVPIGMMLKVIVEWPLAPLPQERFWVEVTQISKDANGNNIYFGELRNRTLLADYGETIGPIFPKNIADVDLEAFMDKQGLHNKETTAQGA